MDNAISKEAYNISFALSIVTPDYNYYFCLGGGVRTNFRRGMCPTTYRNSLKTRYYKLGYSVKPELQRSSGYCDLKTLRHPVTFYKENDFISVYFLILATLIKPYVAVRLIN